MTRRFVLACVLLASLPLRLEAQEVVEFYGTDVLGSVRVVFDQTGGLVARAEFTPFGDEAFVPGALPPEHFAGERRDGESGIDYFNARMLQPRNGRFSTTDPVFNAIENPQAWNRYAYAQNSPLDLVDHSGRDATCPLGEIDVRTNSAADSGSLYKFHIETACKRIIPDSTIPDPVPTIVVPTAPNQPTADPGNHPSQPSNPPPAKKKTALCFVKGVVVGAATAAAIGAAAAGVVALGAPVAAVTGTLGGLALAGAAITGVDLISKYRAGNWNGLAYTAGAMAGSSAVGGMAGRTIAERINGVPSPPWSWSSDAAQHYNPKLGALGNWLSTGPNPGSAGGAAAVSGTGAALAATECQ